MGIARLFAGGVIVVGWAVGIPSGNVLSAEPGEAAPRKVIATVNDQPIYEDQLQSELDKSTRDLRRMGGRIADPGAVTRIQKRLLDNAIGKILIDQESQKLAIENMDQKVEQRIKKLEAKFGAGEGMERYVKIRKMTMDEFRESLKDQVRVDEYLKAQGVLEPEIPEERIRAMYDQDPQSYSTRETAKLSHILIGVDPHAGAEGKAKAREKAEQIRREILEGKDFAELAKQYSTCSTASLGGDLGTVKRGYMPAAFDKVAFALEKGAVSEVVETKFGFHVIKLIDKEPSVQVSYEQMREFLRKYLQEEESQKRLAEHVAELKKKSKIEIYLK